jgi:hypothetical protein
MAIKFALEATHVLQKPPLPEIYKIISEKISVPEIQTPEHQKIHAEYAGYSGDRLYQVFFFVPVTPEFQLNTGVPELFSIPDGVGTIFPNNFFSSTLFNFFSARNGFVGPSFGISDVRGIIAE